MEGYRQGTISLRRLSSSAHLVRAAADLRQFLAGARGWRVTLETAGSFLCLAEALELQVEPTKLILTLRAPDRVWTRRILQYEFVDEHALRLQLGRRGRGDALSATLVAEPSAPTASEQRVYRLAFTRAFRASLLRTFPGARLLPIRRNPAPSPLYVRCVLEWNQRVIAVVGLIPGAGDARGEGLLTTGLLWYDTLSKTVDHLTDLYLLQVQARASTVRRRLRHIQRPGLRITLFEMEADGHHLFTFRRMTIPEPLTQPSGSERTAWPRAVPYRAGDWLLRVINLAPTLIRRHARPEGYDSLRIRGLEFARAAGRRRELITFGIEGNRPVLTDATWPELECLVRDILSVRQAGSSDTRHPLYALHPERWLESLLVDDIKRLAPELDARYVYPQVPVCLGERRGLADILTVGLDGRLVVIEVKASEDRDLPLQGLDYWGAVAWHHRRHEFQRRGYFQGLALSPQPPRLYLVAPLLRLHRAYRFLTSCLDPALDPVILGINLDWRRKLKVLQRWP